MDDRPYIATCGFCEQGLLRPMRCRSCQTVVAVCDECELIWLELTEVHGDPKAKAAGAHPVCPACSESQSSWELLTRTELTTLGLDGILETT